MLVGFCCLPSAPARGAGSGRGIGIAVEFNDHPLCAYVARDRGWFEKAGLRLRSYESYVTGMALAAALARGDIQAAYVCLVPAINVYANAEVPIKIICGTHRYGYGLVVNPEKIKKVRDLMNPGIRIGCVREGGSVDLVLHKVMEGYGLDKESILKKVQRMNPPAQLLAIKTGRLDAAFLPEQWATMAEDSGFKMLLTARDVWPGMQGSVLVVKEDFIEKHPDLVKALLKVTLYATDWAGKHPGEAAKILARQLSIAGDKIFPAKLARITSKFEITPETLLCSMGRLEYTNAIDPGTVQEVIRFMTKMGYLRHEFRARDILRLSPHP
ncbi:MAG: ABC transporter substrate-binding protein [Deltaproteobacteria bacterium]|nr:ABC transporter substrate-binding protein [Deltaproteobacteria bacterium]MBW2017612.1 ABC transporter substrate-binding protein [Deltaproteobacteria bacterium]MBW2128401.1 ABC transporter substrate-binding protein [Deltaproteobacteria bacterium]MBW2304367.1 ABC transporter substrate-binding protein [Deltaproteobacteria bacterium]